MLFNSDVDFTLPCYTVFIGNQRITSEEEQNRSIALLPNEKGTTRNTFALFTHLDNLIVLIREVNRLPGLMDAGVLELPSPRSVYDAVLAAMRHGAAEVVTDIIPAGGARNRITARSILEAFRGISEPSVANNSAVDDTDKVFQELIDPAFHLHFPVFVLARPSADASRLEVFDPSREANVTPIQMEDGTRAALIFTDKAATETHIERHSREHTGEVFYPLRIDRPEHLRSLLEFFRQVRTTKIGIDCGSDAKVKDLLYPIEIGLTLCDHAIERGEGRK